SEKVEMNELMGDAKQFGRRIGMLLMTNMADEKETLIELTANEHKKASISEKQAFMQQNKNILTNAYIITQLEKKFGISASSNSPAKLVVIVVIAR
ncbi:hypothetical protein DFQ30_006781, partial [Apophysomyces sp. BC1015]